MSLDLATVSCVRSHAAAIDRRAHDLVDAFLDAFFATSPHLRTRFTAAHLTQRRTLARRWAWFVRELPHMDRASPELEALGTCLRARGLNHNDFRNARACLLEATRQTSDALKLEWTPQIEAAWAAAFDDAVGQMGETLAPAYQYAQAA